MKKFFPWITFSAIEWLESFLDKDMTIFEWGSGGSTIFISKRIKKLISMEHDREWYQKVSQDIRDNNVLNCDYLLLEPEQTTSGQWDFSNSRHFISNVIKYNNMNFERYVKSICKYSNESFNLVLIDGRARNDCIAFAINKVCFGGVIMLDNSDRFRYQDGMNLLKHWERTDFFGLGSRIPSLGNLNNVVCWQTTIWKKIRGENE